LLSQIFSPESRIKLDPLAREERIIQISMCDDDHMPDLSLR